VVIIFFAIVATEEHANQSVNGTYAEFAAGTDSSGALLFSLRFAGALFEKLSSVVEARGTDSDGRRSSMNFFILSLIKRHHRFLFLPAAYCSGASASDWHIQLPWPL